MDDFLTNRSVLSFGNPLAPSEPVEAESEGENFWGGLNEERTTLCEAEGKRPKVEMVTQDGIVKRLRLLFPDGDILELDCVYPEG